MLEDIRYLFGESQKHVFDFENFQYKKQQQKLKITKKNVTVKILKKIYQFKVRPGKVFARQVEGKIWGLKFIKKYT